MTTSTPPPARSTFKDLLVWQRAMELSVAVYQLTDMFPLDEQHGITLQMRTAATSMATQIAAGKARGIRKDFVDALKNACSSGIQLEMCFQIAKDLHMAPARDFVRAETLLGETMKMLVGLIRKVKSSGEKKAPDLVGAK